MEQIIQLADQLKQALLNSPSYVNYIDAKNELKKDSQTYEKVLEFRNEQMNDRILELDNYQISFDREKYVSKLMSDLMLNEKTSKFFKYENEFLDIFNKVMTILSEDIELDLFGLDDNE